MNLDRITRDPQVMGGKPCIRGMRVTVGALVGLVAAGCDMREILEAYPYVEEEDIIAALRQYESLLEAGALVVVDESISRARALPLRR